MKKTKTNRVDRMPMMKEDEVLTTDDAIEYLKISKPTFLKYIHQGRIKAIKAGNGWRVLQSELYWFLKGGGKRRFKCFQTNEVSKTKDQNKTKKQLIEELEALRK